MYLYSVLLKASQAAVVFTFRVECSSSVHAYLFVVPSEMCTCIGAGWILLVSSVLIFVESYNIESHSTVNEWQMFDDWKCSAPKADYGWSQAAVFRSKDGTKMMLFGGQGHRQSGGNETFLYDFASGMWTKPQLGEAPAARNYAALAALCQDTIVLFGGFQGSHEHVFNDTWLFFAKHEVWMRPRLIGKLPPVPQMVCKMFPLRHNGTQCACKRSLLLVCDSWLKLWELTCIKDNIEYKWVEISVMSPYYPKANGKDLVATSHETSSTIYTLGRENLWLWRYSHVTRSWTNISYFGFWKDSHCRHLFNGVVFLEKKGLVFLGRCRSSVSIFDLQKGSWSQEPVAGPIPWYHGYPSVVLANSVSVLVYAGCPAGCEQQFWNLTFLVNLNLWMWIRIPDSPLSPLIASQRMVSKWGSILYVFGQSRRKNPYGTPVLWSLDLKVMTWSELHVGRVPKFIGGSAHVMHNGSVLLLLGGKSRLDAWLHYIDNDSSIRLNFSKSCSLLPRIFYSSTAINETALLIMGGLSRANRSSYVYGDLCLLSLYPDTLHTTWTSVGPNCNKVSCPSPRYHHSSVLIDSKLLVFGGQTTKNICFEDLWFFDLQTNLWKEVIPLNRGPRMLDNSCYSSAKAVGLNMVVTLRCNRSSCQKQQRVTWLFGTETRTWSIISEMDMGSYFGNLYSAVTFLHHDELMMIEVQESTVIFHMTLRCLAGSASKNMSLYSCRACPRGTYSSPQRDVCSSCPQGLTTSQTNSFDILHCSLCEKNYCRSGNCVVLLIGNQPAATCRCYPGFTGRYCQYPTYILISIAIVASITVGLTGLCFWRKKRRRETELLHQVDELTGAWQIGADELVMQERIGVGGYGDVYKALYCELLVAVKVLRFTTDLSTNQEFEREILFMQTIRHPNIVLFLGAGILADSDKTPFLVTELMERKSLRRLLDSDGEQLSCDHLKRIRMALDAAQGMQFLHGLKPPCIHRDLKSDNLLVSKNWTVKVADFGLGKRASVGKRGFRVRQQARQQETFLDLSIPLVGTTRWRAPELAVRQARYGTAVDVYR